MNQARQRRWFALSLRTVFAVFTILTCLVAYVAGQYNWWQQRQAFLRDPKNCTAAKVRPNVYAPGPLIFRDYYYEKISLATHSKLPPASDDALQLGRHLFPEAEIDSKLLKDRDREIEEVYRANSWAIPQ